jgi:hypothetical protein
MTAEQFSAEYHLLDRVSSGSIETYHAHAATGAMVMAHFLRGTPEENAAITALVTQLRPDRQRKVMRTIEVDGVLVVVTRFILDITTFQEWLQEGVGTDNLPPAPAAAVPAPQILPPPPPPAAASPGEITLMFMAQASANAPPAAPAVPEPVIAPPAPPAPGELTMLFTAAQMPSSVPAPAAAPVSTPVEPPPPPIPPPPAPVSESAVAPPGEITRMFSADLPASATPAKSEIPALQWDTPLAPPPRLPDSLAAMRPSPDPEEPLGNYTRLFAAPAAPPAPPAPAPVRKEPDAEASSFSIQESDTYLHRLYRIDVPEPSTAPPPPFAAPEPAPFAGYGGAQPSEFTRVIESFAPPPPAAPAPAPVAAAAPPPAGKNSTKRYIVAAVIVIAIAIVVFAVAAVFLRPTS